MQKMNPWPVLCKDDVKDVKGHAHAHAGKNGIDFLWETPPVYTIQSAFVVIMNLGKRRKMKE